MGEISEALRRAREERDRATPSVERIEEVRLPLPGRERPAAEPAPPPARAEISHSAEGRWFARAVRVHERSPAAEHYRHFALRVSRALAERQGRVLLVTSAMRSEGKTTTACNLALALASVTGGRRTALVECDLRRPSIRQALRVEPKVGFEDVLGGSARLTDAVVGTDVPGLDLYVVRDGPARPLELLSGAALPAALRELRRRYETVILDAPPVLPVPDVPLVQPHVDAVLVVARSGVCRRHAFRDMLAALDAEKVVGAFMNAAGSPRQRRYYGYYGYGEETAREAADREDT